MLRYWVTWSLGDWDRPDDSCSVASVSEQ